MNRLCWLCLIGGVIPALAQAPPTVNLKGSLELIDTTPDTTPVSALGVAIYSPTTYAMYRAQPDQSGRFEMKNVHPGHYRLELGVPSRLKTFTIGGKEISPADFEVTPKSAGPFRIVLSMEEGALTIQVEGGPGRPLTAVLAPDDEFLTLHSQFSSPLSGGVAQFPFLPAGRYRVFIVDSDLSDAVAGTGKLREALENEAATVDVVADADSHATAPYIQRQAVEDARQSASALR
ncbi:MAG TPA: hypothetical protein VJV22_19085 [Acidobacteriaceae bacterium]|nr:hypothetical protein [Acidobacteriaceae bacterium]